MCKRESMANHSESKFSPPVNATEESITKVDHRLRFQSKAFPVGLHLPSPTTITSLLVSFGTVQVSDV